MAIFSFDARVRTEDLVRCICRAISAILAPESASFRSRSSSSGDHGMKVIALRLQPDSRALRALAFPSRVLSTSNVSRSPSFPACSFPGLQPADVQKHVRAAGIVCDEAITALGVPHFQSSCSHTVLVSPFSAPSFPCVQNVCRPGST